jgi:hypothetical protein
LRRSRGEPSADADHVSAFPIVVSSSQAADEAPPVPDIDSVAATQAKRVRDRGLVINPFDDVGDPDFPVRTNLIDLVNDHHVD